MRPDYQIFMRIAYLRTMTQIKPHDFFYRGELASLLWLIGEIKDSRAYREWKKRFADHCDHFQVTEQQLDDSYISTICVDCGAIVSERGV